MNVLRIGETTHGSDFQVFRKNGYFHYLLLIVETPMLLETDGEWKEVPPLSAILFLPGQRHSYRAFGERYTDCWMHIESDTPLLFEGFPFGKPIPLGAGERFLSLFRIMIGEFYSARRNRVSVLDSLLSALLEMLSSEIGVSGTQFYPFLSLREEVFRFPEKPWNVTDAAKRMCLSGGHFQVLYKRYFSTTFLSDVIASRVQAAEELLLSTDESVSAIAERCGYLNEEHFIRQFRKMTGTTPHRFRLNAEEQK